MIQNENDRELNAFFSSREITGNEFDLDGFVEAFHSDMQAGLEGDESEMPMYPSFIRGDDQSLPVDEPVAVIDAGGTNLRVALVRLKSDFSLEITDFEKYSMPGVDREVGAEEFFSTIADYALPVIRQSSRVGFCFSYPMNKVSAYDGILKAWSKEIKAPEVLHKPVCENLKKALAERGCGDVKITIFNDTISTLLAGRTFNPVREYDGYIGLIVGTGLNTAYLEDNANVKKVRDLPEGTQAINMESAMFRNYPKGPVDEAFIEATKNPLINQLEKICSGGYLGPLWQEYLKSAAGDGLFSEAAAQGLTALEGVQTYDLDCFLRDPRGEHALKEALKSAGEMDFYRCWMIGDRLLERAAKVVAAVISAVVLWTGQGKSPLMPLCVCVDGSTFYKLKGYRDKTEYYLKSYLENEKRRWIELVAVDNASLVGAVVAGLTH